MVLGVVDFLAIGIRQLLAADEFHIELGGQGAQQVTEGVGDGFGAVIHQRFEAQLALFAIDAFAGETQHRK